MTYEEVEHRLATPLACRAAKKGWLKWAILLAASFSALLEVIDTSIVNVAIPDMMGNLGASLSEIGWVSTGYAMANVVIIPLSAWLGDRFGKKRYFMFSVVGFTLSSIACGMATNLGVLIASRIIQGLSGGGLLAKAQAILFEIFPPEEQGKATALFGLSVIVGPTIGPTLGGWLTDTLNWRWIFFINIPFGIFAAWMVSTFFLEDEDNSAARNRTVDWWGIILLAIGLGTFQIVLEQGEQEDWFESRFIQRMSIISVVGLILFVWQELNTKHPAVNLRVLKHKALAAGSFVSLVVGLVLYGTVFVIPLFTQRMLSFTATKTGLLLLPGGLASALAMIVASKILNKTDPRRIIACGAVLLGFVMFDLGTLSPDTGEHQLFWPLVLRGFGVPLMFAPLSIAALGNLPKKDVAAGAAFFSLTRQLGGSMGIAILSTLVDKMMVVHRSELVYNINELNPSFMERMNAGFGLFSQYTGDSVMAQKQSLAAIDLAVNKQSALLSYSDVFYVVGIIILFSLFLLPLLERGGKNQGMASGAH